MDESFASEMEQMFLADFEHATIIEAEALDDKPLWWKASVQLSRLAAPVL